MGKISLMVPQAFTALFSKYGCERACCIINLSEGNQTQAARHAETAQDLTLLGDLERIVTALMVPAMVSFEPAGRW